MFNLVGSPGAGKTSLLEATIPALAKEFKIAVVEGDLETQNDKERIEKLGVPCYQICTHGACHLDAKMVHHALHELDLDDSYDIVFVENVGNLVCPADFPLGEDFRVVVLSVPEGDDKPEKYPKIFHGSDAVVLTKTDLVPHLEFDVEKCRQRSYQVNPKAKFFTLSVKSGEGDSHVDQKRKKLKSKTQTKQKAQLITRQCPAACSCACLLTWRNTIV